MPTVTLTQLQNRVYSRLDNNTQLYPASEVTAMVNECLRILNCFTGILQSSISLPITSQSNRIWYDVPVGITFPMRVQFAGGYLQKMFPSEIGMAYQTWLKDTTLTTGLPVSEWVPAGFTKFGIHPADAVGGATITVTGITEPTLLVNPTDTVTIPNEFTDALVLCAGSTLQLKETQGIFKASSLIINQYYSILKKINLWRSFVQPRYWIPELVEKK